MKTNYLLMILCLLSAGAYGQWSQLTTGTTQLLKAVYFTSDQTGFVGGYAQITAPTLLKTTDGGLTWNAPAIATTSIIRSILFLNDTTGFVSTDAQHEGFRTTDGGTTWDLIDMGIYNNGDFCFKDLDTGFAYSPNNGGDVAFTVNGGISFQHYTNDPFSGAIIVKMHFPSTNSSIGYATSYNGKIFKTTNSGGSWTMVSQPTSQNIKDILFTTELEGYLMGDAFILKTVDGGVNWTVLNSTVGGSKLNIVNNTFYVLRYQDIRISTDNGTTFSTMTGTENGLNDLHILSATSGYTVGTNGRAFKIDSGLSVDSPETEQSPAIFPNPATGDQTMTVILPANCTSGKLTISSVTGIEMQQRSFNEVSGKLLLNTTGLASGIYYLNLSAADGTHLPATRFIIAD